MSDGTLDGRSDLYDVLGVPSTASLADIKRAYRALAKQLHPDTNSASDAAMRFRGVAQAYAVLGDPKARITYDAVRTAGGDLLSGLSGDALRLFQEAFKGDPWTPVTKPGAPRRGKDFLSTVTISMETAIRGGAVPFLMTAEGPCPHCDGSGSAAGYQPDKCLTCAGSGSVPSASGYPRRCDSCHGSGTVVTVACSGCEGSGVATLTRTVAVNLPADIADGTRLCIAGAGGHGGTGGEAGNLYLDVEVAPHPIFERSGYDLRVTTTIPFDEAVLGGSVVVPMLFGGTVRLRIPASTGSGQVFRLRGRGVSNPGGGHGDLYVTVNVVVPDRTADGAPRFTAATGTHPR